MISVFSVKTLASRQRTLNLKELISLGTFKTLVSDFESHLFEITVLLPNSRC